MSIKRKCGKTYCKILGGQTDQNPNAGPMNFWKNFSSEKLFIEGTIDKINADEKN